jgi:hypothetical protein
MNIEQGLMNDEPEAALANVYPIYPESQFFIHYSLFIIQYF